MNDYLTIGSTVLSFVEPAEAGTISAGTYDVALERCRPYARGGYPELAFTRILGALTSLPDPWSGASCTWLHGATYGTSTAYFAGAVVGYSDSYDSQLGWVRDYRAMGLKKLGDFVPVTDSNTLSDAVIYDMPPNTPTTIIARMGRTVGQCVLDVLSMPENAAALTAYGLGNYTSAGTGGAATAVMQTALSGFGTITSLTLAAAGSGYTVAPTIVLAGPCTTQALFTANVSGGAITGFTLVNAGAGYTAPPAVIISTLPSATVSDCAALTVIPPFQLSFCGERLLQSVESVVQTCHPNHWLQVDPAGNIRLLDQRLCTNNTVTLGGSDPRWLMPSLHRDHSDSYSQLIVRGDVDVSGVYLSVLPTAMTGTIVYNGPLSGGVNVNTGGLYPDFAFAGYTTNAAAIAAWTPSSYQQLSLQGGQDQGSCTCSSTTQVVITSSNTALTLTADELDQTATGLHATLTVLTQVASGLQQLFSSLVIANTAMTAGGTSTLTVATPLPSTSYNAYFLTFSSQAGNVVYRRYVAVNPAIGAQLQQYFPYQFAFTNAAGNSAALTSSPVGMVLWSASGSAPWNESDFSVSVDPTSGTILFPSPTALVYGSGTVTPPSNVMAFLPVANGDLQVFAPSSLTYAGTLYTVEGIKRTKTITLREWTAQGSNANIQTFCNEQFDSIKDVVVEGKLEYLGLPTLYLTPGQAVSIAGAGYTTGYESLALPVSSIEVMFHPGPDGTSYFSTLELSNRRMRYSGEVYTRPTAAAQMLGGEFGAGYAQAWNRGMAGFLDSQRAGVEGVTGAIGELTGNVMGASGISQPTPVRPIDSQAEGAMDRARQLSRPVDPTGLAGDVIGAVSGFAGQPDDLAIPGLAMPPETREGNQRQQNWAELEEARGAEPSPILQERQNRDELRQARIADANIGAPGPMDPAHGAQQEEVLRMKAAGEAPQE